MQSLSKFIIPASLSLLLQRPKKCAPTYNGVPVSAAFLMSQAYAPFSAKYPGLELSGVYVINDKDYSYKEQGWPLASSCSVIVPVYEKLSDIEEQRLGNAGIKKDVVARMHIQGECKYGCASVLLKKIQLCKLDGSVVWSWPEE